MSDGGITKRGNATHLGFGLWALLLAAIASQASPRNPDTDWFRDAGWGVFVHYLWDVQNVGGRENTQGKTPTTWGALVREFDTEKFADQVRETGAPYVFFTMMQRTRYLIAPNATYDRLTGYQPGEACSTRDLVADLARSLEKRGIKLMLYWTGDGPREDAQAAKGMGGWEGKVTDPYVQNWADVVGEYSRRYGDKVKGWWTDGCYSFIGYNQARWRVLSQALKTGNPHAIIALNNPAMAYANSSTDCDDFTTGEVNELNDIPEERWRDGKQFHVLSYLGGDWGKPGCRYDLAFLADYVSQVNAVGGVVTLDIALFRDGSLDPKQVDLLRRLGPALKALAAKAQDVVPVPPGNLAYRKPARLLSLDGSHSLPANGGGGRLHSARCGVDGNPATDAQGSAEWPWTFEVDLARTTDVERVVVTFGKDYATHFQVRLSTDQQTWTPVAEAKDHDGRKWAKSFPPITARYVRLLGLKPDGDGQKGGQMSVAELEVYARPVGALSLPRFQEQTVTKTVKYGYQLVAVDLNRDGKKDLIAIDEQASDVAWFENPTWERHVLATNVPRPLNAACWDIDDDGIPEVVLAYRFEPSPDRSVGNVALLTHGPDVRHPWTPREIDRVPTAHRVRWMDPEGNGRKVLLLGPMVGQRFPPVEGDPAPIYLYRPDTWKRETISTEPRGVLHAINPVNWDGTARQQLLAASYAGLHRLELENGKWVVTHLTTGDPRPWPLCGSSEVRLGHLGAQRILAAIEPWHGNQVVVVLPEGGGWKRLVIEDKMDNGHGLAVGDLDGDGRDEIVCGFRGKGCQLSIYQATDARGEQWRKTVLDDGGMAAADCVIEDFNGDGKPDIAAIGASTGNVKLYVNPGNPGTN